MLKGRRGLAYIDVGANNGDFFQGLMEIAEFEFALLIEPLPYLAQRLLRRFPRYTIAETAIGAEERIVEFNEFPDAPAMSSPLNLNSAAAEHFSLAGGNRQIRRVQQRTLDDVAEENRVQRLDLLKIDTQGSEHKVIAGGRKLLEKTTAVWIEVSFVPLYEGSCLFHEIHNALYASGFRLVELTPGWRSPSGELAQADALFQRYEPALDEL
jgi:FkbM family methyltransferase